MQRPLRKVSWLNMNNVLITGASGNVGKACWEYCGTLGISPYIYSNRIEKYIDVWRDVKELNAWHKDIKFDLVIMAHGYQRLMDMEHYSSSVYRDIMQNNLHSCVELTVSLVSENRLADNALIIYMSSIQATQPRKGRFAYAIAKSGLEALARSVTVELQERGIRALALRIGQMTKAMKGIEFTPEQMEQFRSKIPFPLVTHEDIAKLCFTLYEVKSIAGETIEITSGHRYNIW